MELKLTSPAFNNGSMIPSNYTCDGDNINPHLMIRGVPAQARSLALVLENLDAPAGRECHWVLWNIPAETTEIREHVIPFHTEVGINSMKKSGYTGPCPPSGFQRYVFRLYALDRRLDLPPEAGRERLEEAMQSHILATAELAGTYGRTNEAPV